ncbi:MAG: spore cortex biosynthesis protein YabQ [Clostridia bacterium]|nr:spore cortex biosynthesis protein YabQ [Clostridia bacterium]
MYSFEQSEQLKLFLLSLGAGFALGIVYDILRTIRLTFTKSKKVIFVFDIIYFIFFGLGTFIFFLATNKGEFRSYMILGEIVGWIFYYLSLGLAAKSFTETFVETIHAIFKFIFKIISAPFLLIFKGVLKIKEFFSEIYRKVSKKMQKNCKKDLQKLRLYVYNLLGILRGNELSKKKGGYNNGEQKKNS